MIPGRIVGKRESLEKGRREGIVGSEAVSMCQRDGFRVGVAFYVHVMWDLKELLRERSGACSQAPFYHPCLASPRFPEGATFLIPILFYPAEYYRDTGRNWIEHLNGATVRTSIPGCGLQCRRLGSHRRGIRFEEAVVDWKSYVPPVEWTRSFSSLSPCARSPMYFLPLFHDFSFPTVHQTRAIDAAPRVYLSSLSFQFFFFFFLPGIQFSLLLDSTIDPSIVVFESFFSFRSGTILIDRAPD
ncbi:uncharacterized protein LOC114874458 [Osmia bicornis bicornis]|uniref:uncharacterized protein LOC114874458 n=1 Tax=Osmia bicornis bicornis TaxID=1437191 RepID=UPI001EAF0E77|nr:uncharacterized protein LOC114874458 [Osmia bicornis bicornis]